MLTDGGPEGSDESGGSGGKEGSEGREGSEGGGATGLSEDRSGMVELSNGRLGKLGTEGASGVGDRLGRRDCSISFNSTTPTVRCCTSGFGSL